MLKLITRRPPDFIVGDDYLRRWWVIPRNRFFNVYLHNIRKSDDDRALHDHPWPSLSYMLDGHLIEVTHGGVAKVISKGDWTWRSAKFAHRLVVPTGVDVWTLFFTGPRIREWGFHCPQGWRPWREFVDQRDHGKVGRGCGE